MDPTINTKIQKDQGGARQDYGSGSVEVFEPGSKRLTTDGIGSSSLGAMSTLPGAVNVVEEHEGTVHRTILTLVNKVLTTVDDPTNGAQASFLAYAFPRGLIELRGAVLNLALAGDGVNQATTAAVVTALGSVVPAADATLTGTEADMCPSYASTFVASAGVSKSLGVTPKFFDNTTNTNATNLAAHLNLAIPTAGSSGPGTITVNGTITINWFNHGDN